MPPPGDIQTQGVAKSHVWVGGPIIARVCVEVQAYVATKSHVDAQVAT